MNRNTPPQRSPWVAVVLLLVGALGLTAEPLSLNYDKLKSSVNTLSPADQTVVEDAVRLIKAGDYTLALSRLTALKNTHPNNSSLRILASYALVLTGNLVGAFDEAQKAHDAPDGNSYKCWFLAKIALLNGKTAACEREIQHLKKAGDMVAETQALEKEMHDN